MNFTLADVFKISFVATIGSKVADLAWTKLVEPRITKVSK